MANTRNDLNKMFRWVPGHSMTVRDWMLVTDRDDLAVRNIHFSLKHAFSTGRLPNWTRTGHDKFFTKNGKKMTNVQVRSAIVSAIMEQEERTTASGVKALQRAFGVTVL